MISKNQQKYIRQLEQKKYRKREGLFVAEGIKVVGDLLTRYTPEAVFATEQWFAPKGIIPQIITDEELQRISFQQHPQQVLALFPIPSQVTTNPQTMLSDQTLALALDGVQDPGNLGTIIRIADWFGISTLICSEDTADAWNPKVVQATMGSLTTLSTRSSTGYISCLWHLLGWQEHLYGTTYSQRADYYGKRRQWYLRRSTSTHQSTPTYSRFPSR